MKPLETPGDPSQTKSKRAKLYFVFAIVLLFVLAAVWSVDGSFFYLISGPVVIFFYLGFRNLPAKKKESQYQKKSEPRYSNSNPSFGDTVESFFRKKQSDFNSDRPKTQQPKSAKRFFVGCLVLAMFFMIFISLIVSFFGSPENRSILYFEIAEQYYNSQLYDSAYLNYEKASKEDATDERPFIGMGNVAFQMNRLDSALLSYDHALSINPDNSEVQYKKGLILYDQKKYDQSAETLNSLFEKDPTYFDALLKLGDVYYDQKRYEDALRYYDQAYANGVRNNWICYVSGYLYEEKGNKQKAISLYKEALSYDSTVVDIYARLGTLLPGTDGDFFRIEATKRSQQ